MLSNYQQAYSRKSLRFSNPLWLSISQPEDPSLPISVLSLLLLVHLYLHGWFLIVTSWGILLVSPHDLSTSSLLMIVLLSHLLWDPPDYNQNSHFILSAQLMDWFSSFFLINQQKVETNVYKTLRQMMPHKNNHTEACPVLNSLPVQKSVLE